PRATRHLRSPFAFADRTSSDHALPDWPKSLALSAAERGPADSAWPWRFLCVRAGRRSRWSPSWLRWWISAGGSAAGRALLPQPGRPDRSRPRRSERSRSETFQRPWYWLRRSADSADPIQRFSGRIPRNASGHHPRRFGFFFLDFDLVAQMLQHHLDKSQGSLGECLVFAVNEAQTPHHRFGGQRDGVQLARGDLLAAVR